MTISFRTAVLALILPITAGAQSMLAARYPLGLPIQPNSGLSLGMGGTSVGSASDNNVLLRNPANLGAISKAVFSSLVTLDFANTINTATNNQSNSIDFMPRQLSFGVPLGLAGTIGFAFDKRYDARTRFSKRQSVNIASIDSIELAFARDGGMAVWQAGWGHAIGKWAWVGLSYERAYYLLHEARISRTFGYSVSSSVDTTELSLGANGIKLGVLAPWGKLTFGACGEYFFEAAATMGTAQYNGGSIADSDMKPTTFNMTLPPTLAAGISYQPSPEWLAVTDISATMWHYFHDDGMLPDAPTRKTRNAVSFSLGGQYIPAPNLLTPKYWEIIQFHAGARYTQLPAETASEFAFSLGTGLPFAKGGGLFDFVVEYGRRFDTSVSAQNTQEEFVHFGFGFNGGRKWAPSTQSGY